MDLIMSPGARLLLRLTKNGLEVGRLGAAYTRPEIADLVEPGEDRSDREVLRCEAALDAAVYLAPCQRG